jgi:hypothetical protein
MRWFVILLLMLLIFNRAGSWLEKFGLGRLPGDLRFRLFGRDIFVPLASSVLLALLAAVLLKFL